MHLLLGTMYATQPIRFIDWQYASKQMCCLPPSPDRRWRLQYSCTHTYPVHISATEKCKERMNASYIRCVISSNWTHMWDNNNNSNNKCVRACVCCFFFRMPFFQLDQIIWIIILLLQLLSKPLINALGISLIAIGNEPMFRCHAFIWMFYKKA